MTTVSAQTYTRLMSENAREVPMNEFGDRLGDVIGRASMLGEVIYLTVDGTRVAKIVPHEDAWFRSPAWQAMEHEAERNRMAGDHRTFDSADEFMAHLEELHHQADDSGAPGQ
ncbi:hypothetical protein ACIBLB_29090 [Streptosporangium canum]|uniref:hypothetical protein n=3 Tax=Streptosporangium canum TaxID=324952 RepID=UPI0037BD341D